MVNHFLILCRKHQMNLHDIFRNMEMILVVEILTLGRQGHVYLT